MLTLRAEQMVKFSEVALKQFEDRMVQFLAEHFGDQSRMLGESRVRLLVKYGIDQAGKYGIVRERDVCQYIALMFIFGGKFDVNPSLPAIQAVLNDPRLTDSGQKTTALAAAAKKELRRRAKAPAPRKV
jgi:hypothetical protein